MANKVLVTTGARGVGKTRFAATYARPSEVGTVFYHDAERSANNVVEEMAKRGLAFGHYGDIGNRLAGDGMQDLLARIDGASVKGDALPWTNLKERNALADYYLWILHDLNERMTAGKFKVYVHDPIERLEAGMAAWVEAHKKNAGVTITAYGKLWTDGVYPLYEQLINGIHARGVETIIFVSHLRTPWEGNRPVMGKVEPSAKKLLYRLATGMFWLVKEPKNADGAPAALVLKERMGTLKVTTDDEWDGRRMLPERIPVATWREVRRYLEQGCDLINPAPGEVMSQQEREMISELLTDQQMQLMILGAQKDLVEARQSQDSVLTTDTAASWEPGSGANVPVTITEPATAATVAAAVDPVMELAKEIAATTSVPLPLALKQAREKLAAQAGGQP